MKSLKSQHPTPSAYRYVHIILLSWEDDDLDVLGELQILAGKLSRVFGGSAYHVSRLIPSSNLEQWLSQTVNFLQDELPNDEFLHETLLIIYYSGHGGLDMKGEFMFSPYYQEQDAATHIPRLPWSTLHVELALIPTDILLILDACEAAGVLSTIPFSPPIGLPDPLLSSPAFYRPPSPTKSLAVQPPATLQFPTPTNNRIELLAACPMSHGTPLPGPTSFTSILIADLQELIETEEKISVVDLHARIAARIHRRRSRKPRILRRESGEIGDKEVEGGGLTTPVYLRLKGSVEQPSIPLCVLYREADGNDLDI